ncbi:YfjI family protein [Akkermansiaceae bacterium]|nr:YfjI family protein [Akkermansiaceae bacterium]
MKGAFQFEGTPQDETPKTPRTLLQGAPSPSNGSFGSIGEESDDENESPPFPLDLLPDNLQRMAREVSKVALVPESLAAVNLLGFLSSSLGGGLLIDSGGGRITPANLFFLGIAESGTGKGRAFSIVSKPFAEIEAEEVTHWENETLPEIKKDLRLIEKDFKKLEKAIEKQSDSHSREQIGRELQDLERRKAELEKQLASESGYSVADITKEKLAITLEQQPGQALASLSPEGRGVIDVLMGKYGKGKESDEDLYLSAYSRESVKVSRVNRPPVNLTTPCLAVLWLIQPDKARRLTESEAITESGLLPRFLICDSKAEAMDEPEEPYPLNETTAKEWAKLIRDLLDEFRAKGNNPVTIQAEAGARRLIVAYQNASNARRRKGGDLRDIAAFVARWAENAWRLALVLHAGKYGRDAGKQALEDDTARRAVGIVEWFSQEQIAILAPERSNRNRSRLSRLISILSDHQGQRTLRDLGKSHGFTKEEVHKLALEFSTQIELEKHKPDHGGRPSEVAKLTKRPA